MSSVHICTRVIRSGVRFIVRYRMGGRGFLLKHAGSFTSMSEAERTRDVIAAKIAGGQWPDTDTKVGQVYVARLGGLIKIGVSINPERRCRTLNAELLGVLSGGLPRERELQARFAVYRERGEWFRPAPELLAWIEDLTCGYRRARKYKEVPSDA